MSFNYLQSEIKVMSRCLSAPDTTSLPPLHMTPVPDGLANFNCKNNSHHSRDREDFFTQGQVSQISLPSGG